MYVVISSQRSLRSNSYPEIITYINLYKFMLCMTVFQSSTDICRRYIHYTELGRSDSAVFKCINISDVNIENLFEILGIQLSADIIFTACSLYRGKSETVLFSSI